MRVFFTVSYYGKKKFQASYDLVHRALTSLRVDLVSPELGNYLSVLDEDTRKRLGNNPGLLHYEAIRQGIHLSDAVVIEVSQQDIQLGHEISLALMEKKPVLALSTLEDFSKKIHHDYFFASRYTKLNVTPLLQDFLARVRQLRQARRFNMFLYPSQSEYLGRIARKSGMNMSEYVRHLINLDRRASAVGETRGGT